MGDRVDVMGALRNIKHVIIHALHAKLYARTPIEAHSLYFIFIHPIGPCFECKPDKFGFGMPVVVFLKRSKGCVRFLRGELFYSTLHTAAR